MSGCSALATKPEVKEVERKVSNKIDKSEEPRIVQSGGGLGLALASAALSPQVRLALSKLAALAGQLASLFGRVAGLFNIIATLASIVSVTLLTLRVARLEGKVRVQEALLEANEYETRAAKQQAVLAKNEAFAANIKAARAESRANTADLRAGDAINQATAARLRANEADRNAADALNLSTRTKSEVDNLKYQVFTLDRRLTSETTFLSREVERATNKAGEAINLANAAIGTARAISERLSRVQTENARLRNKTELLQSDINGFRVALSSALSRTEAVSSELTQKEDKRVVRRVREGIVTNAANIKGLDGRLIGLPERVNQSIGALGTTLTKTFDDKLNRQKDETDKKLQGIPLATPGTSRDTLTGTQIKDLVTAEVQARTRVQEQMNDKQYQDLSKQLAGVGLLVGGLSIPSVNQRLGDIARGVSTTVTQTSAPALTSAAAAGVCSTTAPGGCMNTNVTRPLQNQLGGMINAAGTAFSAANNALLLQIQAAIAAMSGTVTTIAAVTNTTMGVVTHATHGLAAIQTFASTAWKATRADKILAGISMALTVHNAMMLSNNLLLTMSEATNMALDALGIRDETDSPIDFSRMVKDKIASVLTSILGAEQYAALTARIAKANRIYQASVNVLDTTQALFDSARSVAELTAENTGKIGNALRESGTVYEDAYEEFAEKVNPQNRAQRNLEKFRGSIEGVSEVFETIEGISSNIVEFQETAVQLKEEKKEWRTELDTEIEVKVTEKTEAKEGLQVDADIQKVDFGKAEVEAEE